MKLFDNCKSLIFEKTKTIKGMISDEGETYNFYSKIKPDS